MKVTEIRDLIDFISNSGLDEVNIETEEFKISVKKHSPNADHSAVKSSQTNIQSPSVSPTQPEAVKNPPVKEEPKETEDRYITIKSPMIGTFYRSPNPDSDPFINVGDRINVGDTVCIIEAMKLFNEIESEISGTLVKILVENASPVEYDQPLFLVDPS